MPALSTRLDDAQHNIVHIKDSERADYAEMIKKLVTDTGIGRQKLSVMMGYKSESILYAAETGRGFIRAEKLAWLKSYAKLRARHRDIETAWLERNVAP